MTSEVTVTNNELLPASRGQTALEKSSNSLHQEATTEEEDDQSKNEFWNNFPLCKEAVAIRSSLAALLAAGCASELMQFFSPFGGGPLSRVVLSFQLGGPFNTIPIALSYVFLLLSRSLGNVIRRRIDCKIRISIWTTFIVLPFELEYIQEDLRTTLSYMSCQKNIEVQ